MTVPLAKQFSTQRRLISICVAVYHEAQNIPVLLERLDAVAKNHAHYDFEFLFTDDGSTDSSYELLAQCAQSDYRIRVLRLSRNSSATC